MCPMMKGVPGACRDVCGESSESVNKMTFLKHEPWLFDFDSIDVGTSKVLTRRNFRLRSFGRFSGFLIRSDFFRRCRAPESPYEDQSCRNPMSGETLTGAQYRFLVTQAVCTLICVRVPENVTSVWDKKNKIKLERVNTRVFSPF